MSDKNQPQPQPLPTITDSGELVRRIFRFAAGDEPRKDENLTAEELRQSLRAKNIDPDELLERYRVRLAPYITLKIKPRVTAET